MNSNHPSVARYTALRFSSKYQYVRVFRSIIKQHNPSVTMLLHSIIPPPLRLSRQCQSRSDQAMVRPGQAMVRPGHGPTRPWSDQARPWSDQAMVRPGHSPTRPWFPGHGFWGVCPNIPGSPTLSLYFPLVYSLLFFGGVGRTAIGCSLGG